MTFVPIEVYIVDLNELTATEVLHSDNTTNDTTQADDTNTVWVCQTTNDTAELTLGLTWIPTNYPASEFRWEALLTNGAAATEWGGPATFENNPTNIVWTPTAATNREFQIRAWYDRDANNTYTNTEPHRIIDVKVVDFVKLMLTNSATSNAVVDVTREDEPASTNNTLYLVESTNGTAKMDIQGWWAPTNAPSNLFMWELRLTNEVDDVDEWDIKEGTFATNPVPVTWTAGGDTNREFLVRGWYDCNKNGIYDSDEPHRMLYVNIIKVDFKELGENYGWDNYTDPTVPWKSVEDGNKTDTVKAEIAPVSAASQVYFKSTVPGKVAVSPAQASASPETVTVTGVAKGESEIQANIGGVDGMTCAKMKPKCYTKKAKTIAVTLVHEMATPGPGGDAGYISTDMSDADITNMLAKVYKQSVQEFALTRIPAKTVDFDDNHDGKLDTEDVPGWMNPEMAKIRDACQSAHDYNIFIVSHGSYPGGTGLSQLGAKFVFVHVDSGANSRSVCHELGHAQGRPHSPDADTENIMYKFSSPTKWRLRKDQWDLLNF
jgi:hypothetical protein